MADAHVQIECTSGATWRLAHAIAEMHERDGDFPDWYAGHRWWHKPPDTARQMLARCLSRHGLSGRLSVVVYDHRLHEGLPDNVPPPLWSGFTARGGDPSSLTSTARSPS